MKIKILMLSCMCMAFMAMSALSQGDPKWKVELNGKAKWMTISSAGTVIVSTNSALTCIDPEKQQKIWEIKSADEIPQESFLELPGTPFAIYESSNPLKSLRTQTTIIDFMTGRVVYNNVEAETKVLQNTPLLDIGAILLEIKQDKKVFLSLVEIETGKERWKIGLPDRKTGVGLGSLKQSIKSVLTATAVSDKDGNILYPDDRILKKLDGKTGNVLWTSENEKTVKRLNFSDDGSVVYLGAGRKVSALNLTDGKDIWKDPIKISGEFEMFVPSENGKMYVVTSSDINLIENATGKAVWKKPVVFAEPFINMQFTNDGILVFGGGEKSSMFDYIGFDGTKLWKRPYSTTLVVDYRLTPKGIIYANETEANMIDLKTGDDTIWKKRIKLKGRPVTYIDEKIALVYSDGKLNRVNMETLAYELLTEDIKFKGSDEDVQRIEVLSNGYLLSSSQNMWLVDESGKTVYNVYYKPASLGTAAKILGRVGQVYATMSNLEATQDPSGVTTIKRSEKGDAMVEGIGSIISNRKKSFSTQNANYIMTHVEEGNDKRVGMVKVDKQTGKEQGKIVIRALEPIYEIDYVTGSLFVVINEKASTACDFSCFGL